MRAPVWVGCDLAGGVGRLHPVSCAQIEPEEWLITSLWQPALIVFGDLPGTGKTTVLLTGTISYRRVTTPDRRQSWRTDILAHLFNHQTHYHGQAHAILTRLVGHAPELDLLFYQRSPRPAT